MSISDWSSDVCSSVLDQPEILRYLVATNISTSVSGATRHLAVLLVGGFIGPASAGLYRLANQLSASLTKIAGLLSKSIFAELVKCAPVPMPKACALCSAAPARRKSTRLNSSH